MNMVNRHPMRALLAATLLLAPLAHAQPPSVFGPAAPLNYKEEEMDRRFERSRFQKALSQGTNDPRCAQLLGGLLTLLAETAPTLHKFDENFTLEPHLLDALGTQLTTPRFPGNLYLALMVRRVFIDKKLPPAWLETASRLRPHISTIDVGKLRYLSDGARPIENVNFTLNVLRERYAVEVQRATSIAAASAESLFRDNYLDREVTFTGLELDDLTTNRSAPPPKKGERGGVPASAGIVAHLMWKTPKTHGSDLKQIVDLMDPEDSSASPGVKLTVRLRKEQYLDLTRLPKGTRVLVRGRLWDYKDGMSEIELRDAVLFHDRDWSKGVKLAAPTDLVLCPFAVNEVSGLAPQQGGGFETR